MNIRNNKKLRELRNESIFKNLNESVQIASEQQRLQDTQSMQSEEKIQEVIESKDKQFTFNSGVSMADIKQDIGNKFGLKWHYENTSNEQEFIESVKNFVESSGVEVTSNDLKRLSNEYLKA